MKKLISLFLSILMVVSLFAGITASAVTTDGDFEYYYFSYANLKGGGLGVTGRDNVLGPNGTGRPGFIYTVNAMWYSDPQGGAGAVGYYNEATGLTNYDNHSGAYYFGTLTGTANASNTFDVYVTAGGEYTIWALVTYKDAPDESEVKSSLSKYTSGWTVAVNNGITQDIGNEAYVYDEPTDTEGNVQTVTRYGRTYVEYKNQYYWDKVTVNLEAGKNRITLKSTGSKSRMQAMLITNDNARTSDKFAYIGSYDSMTTANTAGYGSVDYKQNIKYFSDGRYHANWEEDGFINLREYSDIDAPTVEIATEADDLQEDSITFSWTAADPKREWVGTNPDNGNGYASTNGEVSTFYADASGIYETRIYESDNLIATVPGDTTTFTFDDSLEAVEGVFAGSSYNFKVEVMDRYGNVTADTATFTTSGDPDTIPPTWPEGGKIEVENAGLSSVITWPEASDNTQIFAYEIYEVLDGTENLIGTVGRATTSYTVPLSLFERKEVKVIAKDRVGLDTEEGLTATLESTAGRENFVIRPESFDLPTGDWRRYNITGTQVSDYGCYALTQTATTSGGRGQLALSEKDGARGTAKIYVDEPGEYLAFMHVEQNGEGFYLSINDKSTTAALGSSAVTNAAGKAMWNWVKADKTWNLVEGWNEIEVTSVGDDDEFTLIYITNAKNLKTSELTYVINNNTDAVVDGKLNTAKYEDVTAPVFEEGVLDVEYDLETNTVAVAWPAAADEAEGTMSAAGFKGYKLYVNDKEIAHEGTAASINEASLGRPLVPGEVLNIKIEALDKYGNKSEKTVSYEVSKFVIDSFCIKNSTEAVDTLAALNDGTGSVNAELVIKNISAVDADIRLSIAIYKGGNMIAGDVERDLDGSYYTVVADGNNYTVTASVTVDPADLTGCVVKAHLWDANNLSPASTTWATIKLQ